MAGIGNFSTNRSQRTHENICALSLIALFTITTRGQGMVTFANTASTPISSNHLGSIGLISGAGNYLFALYIGPLGASSSQLTLAFSGVPNSSTPRLFGGGTPAIPGAPPGNQISFQVRGWSGDGQGGASGVLFGQSSVGFVTLPAFGSVPLFGTGAGQVGGFTLSPLPVPEPSTYAMVLLGFAL